MVPRVYDACSDVLSYHDMRSEATVESERNERLGAVSSKQLSVSYVLSSWGKGVVPIFVAFRMLLVSSASDLDFLLTSQVSGP